MTTALPDLALRSLDATWDRAMWEQLPHDGKRYEVIEGVLYVSTAPSVFHQWIIRQLVRILFAQIDDAGVGVTLWSPIGVFMPGCDPVQPDVLVIGTADLGMMHDRRVFGVPALLIEILSPSNAQVDTETKRQAYARAGLSEYWIVRPIRRDAVIYSQPDQARGDYARSQIINPGAELISPSLPVRFALDDLFLDAPDTTI